MVVVVGIDFVVCCLLALKSLSLYLFVVVAVVVVVYSKIQDFGQRPGSLRKGQRQLDCGKRACLRLRKHQTRVCVVMRVVAHVVCVLFDCPCFRLSLF